jgi:hypothetical protein
MRYFTPELLSRIRSLDEDVSAAAHQEWERALVNYQRRWAKIKAAFPEGVRRFEEDPVCLHDAQVLSMGQQGDTFAIVSQLEPPSRQLVVLTFTLDEEPIIETTAFPGKKESSYISWMYEEFDVDRRKKCWFRLLLSNGWVVKLCFRDFQCLIAQTILPVTNGHVRRVSPAAIPQSA